VSEILQKLPVATIANTSPALRVPGWGSWGIAPHTWAVIMVLVASALAGVVGRVANGDNVHRRVFIHAYRNHR